MPSGSFKVIVVGGGPIGLTAAHGLHKAGIDFLILERRPSAVIYAGSDLVLTPIGLGVTAQLGLSQAINSVSTTLGDMYRMDHHGRDIGTSRIFRYIESGFGHPCRVLSRHDVTKVLYENLPSDAQRKIICNKRLSNITTTADGVIATCEDGSSYTATAVIGADGAHSSVREFMQSMALKAGAPKFKNETPFLTTFRAFWVRFPKFPDLSTGSTYETHGLDAATQLFVGEETGVVGVYERLPSPTRERIRHTPTDQDAFIERWGHLPVVPGSKLSLRDLYESRQESGLVSLEEGVIPQWSWDGRIVLVGDAAHKYTPSTGAGCNAGMLDIVVLVNELHALTKAASLPSRADIASAFTAYQNKRQDNVTSECATANGATSMATWQSGLRRFLDCHVFSRNTFQWLLIKVGSKFAPPPPSFNFFSETNNILEKESGLSSASPVAVA